MKNLIEQGIVSVAGLLVGYLIFTNIHDTWTTLIIFLGIIILVTAAYQQRNK